MLACRRFAVVVALAVAVGMVPTTPGSAGGQTQVPQAAAAFPPVSALAASQPAVRAVMDCIVRTNAERTSRGLVALTADARLATAAITHSNYQAVTQTMTHFEPGARSDGGQRATAAGYIWTAWGENVAAGQPDCASVITAWMGSSSHRTSILNGAFRHIGIGCIMGTNGVRYWTMLLGAGG